MIHYHSLKTIIDTGEVLKEYCEECKDSFIFKKSPEGRMDNKTYREVHKKDLLQPSHKHYEKEYGVRD